MLDTRLLSFHIFLQYQGDPFCSFCVSVKKRFWKYLCSETQCVGYQFLVILVQWGISFYAVVVFGLGKDFLFKSVLGRCAW